MTTLDGILAAYDFETEMRPRLRKAMGPFTSLDLSVQDATLASVEGQRWLVQGRLRYVITAIHGDASMQSSGDSAFALALTCGDDGGVRLEDASLEVAGFPKVDLEADRTHFEALLDRAIAEAVPQEGEGWAQALSRHAPTAAVCELKWYPHAVSDPEPFRARLTALRERLLTLRERGFEAQASLRYDEAAGWTADALDVVAELTQESWRPCAQGHADVLRRLAGTLADGSDADQWHAFQDEVEEAFRETEGDTSDEVLAAVAALRGILFGHDGDQLPDQLQDWVGDYYRNLRYDGLLEEAFTSADEEAAILAVIGPEA